MISCRPSEPATDIQRTSSIRDMTFGFGTFILGAVKLCHLWRGYKAPARASAPRKRVSSAWCILRLNVLFDYFDWRAAT